MTWTLTCDGILVDQFQDGAFGGGNKIIPQSNDSFYVVGDGSILRYQANGQIDSAFSFDWMAGFAAGLDGVQTVVIRMDNLATTEFQPNDALAVGSYRVWVRAVSTTGELSLWSLEVNFSIAAASPPDFLDKPRQGSDTVDDDLLLLEELIPAFFEIDNDSSLSA